MESTYDMTDTVLFVVAFGLYDVDNSGLIDESEFRELATNMLVGQANGVRSHATLLAALQFCFPPIGQQYLAQSRGRHDAVHEEFSTVWPRHSPCLQEYQLKAMIREEFTTADADKDGMVSLEEWRTAATNQTRIIK